ncbi:sugar ABC transporter substrate-binding protein [Leptolyngbyaceae cyanobacterium CCMR0082]|uniref:Sugar ABC transporter substrate-binding protein n=3 Tax=Adonisia TaxID=2950183 RepID=A0A6M0SF83_9CYAN|nr:sugar ABC transporter substrate-binding protein [Adonisia turfae CCMR0081]NEZ67135.1 sugar ABC transporter substrate-binding protein [Adonisia turfae CCMR0082]
MFNRRLSQQNLALLCFALCAMGISTSPANAQLQPLPGLDRNREVPTSRSAAPTSEAIAPPSETSYTLGAGDVVRVDIFRVPQYSGESEVLVDGTLNLPLVGPINVAGLTLGETTELLSSQYGQYLKRPLITLSLLNRRPLQVGISGEINSPGSYTLTQTGTQAPRLSQLLERAGGVTQVAAIRDIQIQRPGRNGEQQTFTVDLWELLETGNSQYDISLRDGDSIFIPTGTLSLQEASFLADASFAASVSQPINVAVIGEVYRPGPYTLQGGRASTGDAGVPGASSSSSTPTTVTRALQLAGGIKPRADIRKVQVVRPTRSGETQVIDVDLWKLLEVGDIYQDVVLQPNDTIFVPVATALNPAEVPTVAGSSLSPNSIRVNVVGEVSRSGVIELPPDTSLSQAILAAGGFNRRARKGEAELIRLNADGTVARETIPVDFAQAINDENNPILQNNDVVIVNPNALARVTDDIGAVLEPVGQVIRNVFSPLRFLDILD